MRKGIKIRIIKNKKDLLNILQDLHILTMASLVKD